MGFLNRIVASTGDEGPDERMDRMFGADTPMSAAGVPVSNSTAMRLSAVWAAYRVLVEGVAALPLITYRRTARGKERATAMPLYDVLRWQPNKWQTSMEYIEGVTGNCVLRGNHYALIVPGPRGFADQLEPMQPDQMGDVSRTKSGRIAYKYWDPSLGEHTYFDDEIFHVRGMGEGGLLGLSVIAHARDNFGAQLAREHYQAQLFAKKPMLAGILEVKEGVTIDEEQEQAMVSSFRRSTSGPGNFHSIAMLQGGVSWKPAGMKNDELQFIEMVDAGVNDIARWFNVPVHLLRSQKDPNHSNIEMFDQELVTHTLRPWCVRIEQAIHRDLILDTRQFFVEFLLDALARAAMAARYQSYQSGIQSGWLLRNEAREKENLNPIDGLDEPLQPLNMGTPGQMTQARKVVQLSAERVVRKEIEALRAAAPKYAGKPAEWHAFVGQFYAKHERLVSQALGLKDDDARVYVLGQRTAVLTEGLGVLEAFGDEAPGALVAMVFAPTETAA